MNLSPSTRSRIATRIANHIRLNAIGYVAVATPTGHAGYPEAAVTAIASTGRTDCTAKVAVYRDRLVYTSATGTHVSYPTHQEDAERIVYSFLAAENN